MNAKQVFQLAIVALLSVSTVMADPTEEKKATRVSSTASTSAFSLWMHQPAAANVLKVHVQKHSASTITVVLRDQKGTALHESRIYSKQSGRAFAFNLSELGDGTYSLEITGDGQQVSKTFELTTPSATRVLTVE